MDGNDPAGSRRSARFDALRAGCPAAHVEFLRCGPRSRVLVLAHEQAHAQLPNSRLSGWRVAPASRALIRGRTGSNSMSESRRFSTFAEFYPFYLGEHSKPMCRRLHFVGTTIAAVLLIAAALTQRWWLVAVAVLEGYAFAWVGHYFFEHNRPATFRYPLFSLMGDWRLWYDILRGRQQIRD